MTEQKLRFAETIATTFQDALSLIYKSIHSITNDLLAPFLIPVLTLYFIFIQEKVKWRRDELKVVEERTKHNSDPFSQIIHFLGN